MCPYTQTKTTHINMHIHIQIHAYIHIYTHIYKQTHSSPCGKITAAATTGPARGPRPASSTPATLPKPSSQSSISCSRVGPTLFSLFLGVLMSVSVSSVFATFDPVTSRFSPRFFGLFSDASDRRFASWPIVPELLRPLTSHRLCGVFVCVCVLCLCV